MKDADEPMRRRRCAPRWMPTTAVRRSASADRRLAAVAVVGTSGRGREEVEAARRPRRRSGRRRHRRGAGRPARERRGRATRRCASLAAARSHSDKTIVIEGYADANARRRRAARERPREHRAQPADRSGRGAGAHQGRHEGRAEPTPSACASSRRRRRPQEQKQAAAAAQKGMTIDAQPVGESHFANPTPMTVERGASAMVSMVRKETDGEVVYLYDAESERGNANFAFRAVRFTNPTTRRSRPARSRSTANERFIGEGLTEPIPPKASAVVPVRARSADRRRAQRRRGEQALAARHAPARHPDRARSSTSAARS